ncbi:DUF3052 domain-containing protein [Frateuria sp. MAH-13]|uniref:DUF3052 domain-containing protein n=1 Tax=Frateuria flava TaxID=2821489 RepID=A0ABS4DJS2_9GAMM|nr:DUF3052 domain-containing protein [Frateuria flava]MBP1473280.1 DUF3052 domain-containing protein [Frateuria flava]
MFAKLNLKDQDPILVIDAPASFEPTLQALEGMTVLRDPAGAASVAFALAFVTTQRGLDAISALLADKTEGDAVLWFAYPKGSSRRYRCEFNRDSGWDVIRARGFDSVRQVAIDEDWSALRFRPTGHIGRAPPRR